MPGASAIDRRVVEFQNWLRRHRGLSERTIELADGGTDDLMPWASAFRKAGAAEQAQSAA
jgi:hypothetical protein